MIKLRKNNIRNMFRLGSNKEFGHGFKTLIGVNKSLWYNDAKIISGAIISIDINIDFTYRSWFEFRLFGWGLDFDINHTKETDYYGNKIKKVNFYKFRCW